MDLLNEARVASCPYVDAKIRPVAEGFGSWKQKWNKKKLKQEMKIKSLLRNKGTSPCSRERQNLWDMDH